MWTAINPIKKLVTNTLIPPCLLKLFWKNSWIWRWLWKKYLVFNEAEEYLFKWSYLVFQTKIVNQEHGNIRKFHWQNYVDGSCSKCRDMNLPMYFFFQKMNSLPAPVIWQTTSSSLCQIITKSLIFWKITLATELISHCSMELLETTRVLETQERTDVYLTL